ncbi:hypothetical protein [Xanthomarina sp. GH4-25]|uniref:hypothetical protein n=1 Tax=Xanthomarina sp. GH4-25 TaxID=3349335 RepID=UPI000D673EFB|nr:hypothetical protein DI383_03065 [Flavobacteriaceae bacterium LYZ1037]
MGLKKLAELSNEELLEENNKIQYNKIVNAAIIGLCIGIAVYSAVKNGFGFFTFFPLLLTYPFIKNGKKIKELEKELKSRNL